LQAHSWSDTETAALCLLAGLGISLAIAGFDKIRAGYRIQGRLAAFFFFLLLESPTLVYAGILLGMAAAAKLIGKDDQGQLLIFSVAGGAAVGFVFWLVRHLRNKWARFGVILALAAGIPAAGIYWLHVDESIL